MPDSSDLWYVRLPGGHVVRAASATLREQLASGRLSQLAEVRRSKEEAWRSMSCIDKSGELYNHRSRQSVAARLDPGTMNFLPINEFLEELLAALGCALSARKLQLTLIGAFVVGVFLALFRIHGGWVWSACVGLAVLTQTTILSRLTFCELSRLKPVSLRTGFEGLPSLMLRLLASVGLIAQLLFVARQGLPRLLPLMPSDWPNEALIEIASLFATLSLGASLIYLTPLVAVLVVEDCGPVTGFLAWHRLTRGRRTAVMATQWLTLAIGLVLTAPVGMLAWVSLHPLWQAIVQGAVVSVVTTYVAVANVFLYLHFRYASN